MHLLSFISTFLVRRWRWAILFLSIVLSAADSHGQAPTKKPLRDTVAPKIDSLTAVIVRPKTLPPRLKGDTLEYNTENIRLKPNAAVEELLGRLPGLQIDANGAVTMNGEKINRLLVDGEDLFSSDPTIVTRNFNADMIARVQVLDKKSDQAEFTGIDDGARNKTLNLVLKENAKKGFFGKVEAGGNPQGTYDANGFLGSFKGREQFTALGLAANTGSLGFSSNTSGSQAGLSVLNGTSDPLGASAGTGIPRVVASGLHCADTWDGKEDHVVGNYQFGRLFTRPVTTSRTAQSLHDSTYVQDQRNNSVNSQEQHIFYGTYDYIPDSLSAFRLFLNGLNMQGHNQFASVDTSSFNDTLVNTGLRTIRSEVANRDVNGSASWRSRSRKKNGRSLSLVGSLTKIDNTTTGYLYAVNRFYSPGGSLLSADTTDQRKQLSTNGTMLYGNLNYTEPLWKHTVLGLSYGISWNANENLQSTYNRGDGKYLDYVDSLSSHLKSLTLNEQFLLNFQGKYTHLTYTVGGTVLGYDFRQRDLLTDSLLRYHYLNFAPRVLIHYTFNQYNGVFFNYGASTQQPSIQQLQPVKNNNDPLHIVVGNPELRPSFMQNFWLSWRRLKPVVMNLNFNFGLTDNSISTRTLTDSLGRQISQSVNVGGAENAGLNFSINKKLEPWGVDAGLYTSLNYARSVNFINADLSRNDNYSSGGGLSLAKNVPDRYSIRVNAGLNYFYARSSINVAAPTRYWGQSHSVLVSFLPFRGFEINSNANYTWQEKTSVFGSAVSVLLWNAFVSQNFYNNQLVLRLSVNNLLDQDAGISRGNVLNINNETRTNVMGRYWMLSAVYHFTHRGKGK